MESQAVAWSFLNEETGQSIDGLTFEQARFVASLIDHRMRMAWLVWYDGLADWMGLDECDQLMGTSTIARPRPPIPPNRPSAKKSKKKDADEIEQLLEVKHESKSEPASDRRAHRRFRKNFPVEISTPVDKINTFTENISLSGMILQDVLPLRVERVFHATILRKNHGKLRLLCEQIRLPRAVLDEGTRRVRFVKVEDHERLNAWLLDQGME